MQELRTKKRAKTEMCREEFNYLFHFPILHKMKTADGCKTWKKTSSTYSKIFLAHVSQEYKTCNNNYKNYIYLNISLKKHVKWKYFKNKISIQIINET